MKRSICTLFAFFLAVSCLAADEPQVGPTSGGSYVASTEQLIRPAGKCLEFGGRPVDLTLSPDSKTLYVKTNGNVLVVDTNEWKIRQAVRFGKGLTGSYHGLVVTADGWKLYVTTSQATVLEGVVAPDGTVTFERKMEVPGQDSRNRSTPCGIALSPGEGIAYVCLSRNNSLGVLNLSSGKLVREIPVGVAPYDVAVSPDGRTAYVSNWGGRHPLEGEKSESSSGTPTLVDERSIPCSGTVSVVDLREGKETEEIPVGLHPCDLEIDRTHDTLYVTNANSDTVSVVDLDTNKVTRSIDVKPEASLPFGSAPNGIALSKDGRQLYVANGGNNAVAVVDGRVRGFIPAGWYPGAVVTDGSYLYIANVKGWGSRDASNRDEHGGWRIHSPLGTVQKVEIPDPRTLRAYSKQVLNDSRAPHVLAALEKAQTGVKPQPIPDRVGEPSLIGHVVYIIKENKTYDQLFGDMPRGNSDPNLCTFGRRITPNHHALANQFVLLDNFYCNGVCSADGHQWVTEGYATDYMEKAFGGWPRSYPFAGDDAMAYSSAGFIWDNVLLHGLSFRNYGEMSTGTCKPKGNFKEILADCRQNGGKFTFSTNYNIEPLRRYSCPEYPGWNLGIPESVRIDTFLREFEGFVKKAEMPDFVTLYFPNDHTAGLSPGAQSPRAMIADNDLALGRVVEAISKSPFWSKTAIFVIQDDPQSGLDHVDGHRSICLVISPYTRRGALISKFYNQTSVLHTMELILGLPPMNQMDAMAPVMRECFVNKPDLTPYTAVKNNIPLDETNPKKAALCGKPLYWAEMSAGLNFTGPDRADDDMLNRILWHSMKGFDTPYPAEFAGPHGKGLKALHLTLAPGLEEDRD